jgi:8-oxo-dGTP pyrophosphatase MutT (NUDIX family)
VTAGSGDGTRRLAQCALAVGAERWAFAERHEAEIAAHWQRSRIERPKLFDGAVYLLGSYAIEGRALTGTLLRTDFKSYLYWREHGYGDRSMRDAFGASLIRSSEGYVLLGRQTEGNMNAGIAYPPSGMIDDDDVQAGMVDIEASIVRELAEETGLTPADLERTPGYVLTISGRRVAIAIEWRSPLNAHALRERILAHIRSEREPELADVVIVRSAADIGNPPVQDYAVSMLRLVMPA